MDSPRETWELVEELRLDSELVLSRRIDSTGSCSAPGAPKPFDAQVTMSLEIARLHAQLRREIGERHRSEAALRLSEERYALAVDAASDGHADWIVGTDEFHASPRLLEICGFPAGTTFAGRAEFLSRFPFHPQDRERVLDEVDARCASAAPRHEFDIRIVRDGQTRWLHVIDLHSRDASGRLTRAISAVTDITDRKNAQDDVRRMEQQLRQARRLESLGTLAGGIAHDFNNVLGIIRGYGEKALTLVPRSSPLRHCIANIFAAAERGRALVERIPAFSRSGSGEQVAVDVAGVVLEVLDLLSANLPPRISIDPYLDIGRAAMLGDPLQVHQVVMNLATNALQAMEHGTLRIQLALEQSTEARIASSGIVEPGEYIVLTVADQGTGIAPGILEHIFEPFFTTKDVGVGTGLGLSLVQGIVASVGGAIRVDSVVGQGSVFTVWLPRSGDAEELLPPRAPGLSRGRQQCVLLVDDEEPLLRLMTDDLVSLGYRPDAFVSSEEALEAFRSRPDTYDAIVADDRMSRLPGTALVEAARALRPDIPSIIISGHRGSEILAQARECGADAVLQKPASLRELAAALKRALLPSGNPPR